jgi:hypothetical protein
MAERNLEGVRAEKAVQEAAKKAQKEEMVIQKQAAEQLQNKV